MARKWYPHKKQQSLLELFGIDYEQVPEEWNVKFGAQLVQLSNQKDPGPYGYYATTERLVDHLGLLEDVYNNPLLFAMYQEYPNEWERRKASAVQELERKTLAPMRKQMERLYHFSFYRSGLIRYAPDEDEGLVAIVANGEPIVKPLPLSVEVAKKYGMSEADIELIAPEAVYVLEKKKIAHRAIRTENELLGFIDGWMAYTHDTKVRKRLYQSFKTMTPCIVGKRVTQLLLPRG